MAIRTFIYPAPTISIPGVATEATLLLVEQNTADTVTELQGVNTELNSQTTILTDIETNTASIDGKIDTTNAELVLVNAELNTQTALLTTIDADTGSIDTKLTTTNAELVLVNAELDTHTTLLTSIDTELNNIESALSLSVVDQLDTPLLDTSGTNIPASASLPLEVVASTAAIVRKLVQVDDIGEFIGIYTGPASSEVLLAVMPLGGGEMEVNIPASTRISLRNMQNSAISTGMISINFLG